MSSKPLSNEMREQVLTCLLEQEILANHWPEVTIYVGGSFGVGIADQYSDVDAYVLCPKSILGKIVDDFIARDLIEKDERFFVELPIEPFAHFSVNTVEQAFQNVAECKFSLMHEYAHSIILHDPLHVLKEIQTASKTIQPNIAKRFLKSEYLSFIQETGNTNNSLRRMDEDALCLCAWKGIEHVLRVCCLLDCLPYPSGKRIIEAGLETTTGRELRQPISDFLELLKTNVLEKADDSIQPSLERHYGLETYKYYGLRRQIKSALKERMKHTGFDGKWLSDS